jgi:uncharacterized protein
MDSTTLLLAAFLLGLTGGVHCFGMCGGIVGALTLGLPLGPGHPLRTRWPYLLAYNVGRIASYAAAGALAGGVGAWAAHLLAVHHAQLGLQILAGLFMILLGCYLAGWWLVLNRLEQAGGVLWRRIEPLGRRLFPVRTPVRALGIGLVWGWLPCGLVYSVLVWAIAAGGAAQGALLLLSFGWVRCQPCWRWARPRRRWRNSCAGRAVRHVAGGLVILFGVYEIGLAVRMLWG